VALRPQVPHPWSDPSQCFNLRSPLMSDCDITTEIRELYKRSHDNETGGRVLPGPPPPLWVTGRSTRRIIQMKYWSTRTPDCCIMIPLFSENFSFWSIVSPVKVYIVLQALFPFTKKRSRCNHRPQIKLQTATYSNYLPTSDFISRGF
jgi:hypothetical protein